MLGNVRIGVRLGIAFALVVALLVLLATMLIATMDRLGELEDQVDEHAKEALAIVEADSRLEHVGTLVAAALINREIAETRKELAEIRKEAAKDIAVARTAAETDQEKAAVRELERSYTAYLDLMDQKMLPAIEKSQSAVPEDIKALDEEGDKLSDAAMRQMDILVEALTKRSEEKAIDFDRQRESGHTTAVILTVAGCALALVLAVIATLGITRPLARARDFALALSRGDLDRPSGVNQKDEVGQTARAAEDVRQALQRILGDFSTLVEEIRCGKLTRRGDPSQFHGAFADLITGFNSLCDVLVGLIDVLPMTVMSIDRDCGIQFLNKQGLKLSGKGVQELTGTRCHDLFKTGDCKTPQCASSRAMRSGRLESSETVSKGLGRDLDFAYSAIPLVDGKGAAAGAIEILVDQTQIRNAQRTMQELAAEAERISLQVSSAAEELSAQVEQSSRGAETQSQRASEAATAMDEMNSTVVEVARNAATAAGTTDGTKAKAEEGAGIVSQVVQAIHEVQRDMATLSGNMNQLGRQAEDIGRIMTVITDIADQTNLLALNAAIEAARAGDAGRGFAVVADEVRKLAEKTMTATKEVGDAITGIQNMTKMSVEAVASSSRAVDKSTELAGSSGQALEQIVNMVDTAADQVRSIATAAEEQSAAADEIAKATAEINQISTETSQAMNQSAQAIGELARLAQDMKDLIKRMTA